MDINETEGRGRLPSPPWHAWPTGRGSTGTKARVVMRTHRVRSRGAQAEYDMGRGISNRSQESHLIVLSLD